MTAAPFLYDLNEMKFSVKNTVFKLTALELIENIVCVKFFMILCKSFSIS